MKIKLKQSGFVMPSIIITALFLTTMGILITELAVSNFRTATEDRARLAAQFATDAGLDYGIAALNNDNDWVNTSGEKELQDDGVTRTTFEVSAVDGSSGPDEKIVTAIGRAYEPTTATTPKHERTFVVNLRGLSSGGGTFSVVTGVGGLYMHNSSKIVAGDVNVNGLIEMKNSSQIGTTFNTVNVNVAHQSCPQPADSSYPSLCGPSSGDPIKLFNSAIIYGDVKANNQTTTDGLVSPGLTQSSGVTPAAFPTYDRDAHKTTSNASGNTMTGSTATCDSGTRIWPAGLKITGNVEIRNSCNVEVQGDIWVTGSLILKNSATMTVSNSLSESVDIMVDGDKFEMNNSSKLISNSAGDGFNIRAYRSNAACSPDCSSVTGTDLYNSRNIGTIELKNSSEAPESALIAVWSKVTMNNGGDVGALVGQTVELKNSAAVTFGTAVPTPGGDPTYTYILDEYRRQN